jgi:hypothetical protein
VNADATKVANGKATNSIVQDAPPEHSVLTVRFKGKTMVYEWWQKRFE